MSGSQSLCPNQYEYYSVPSFPGASYHWTVYGGVTLSSGQGTNNILINTGSSFSGGRVECNIIVGNCTQLKSQTLSPKSGCSPYYLNVYPNPVSQSENLNVKILPVDERNNSLDQNLVVKYYLHDPYSRPIKSVNGIGSEEVFFVTHGLSDGLYTVVAVFNEETLREKVYIKSY